jgi:hypothetical protein
MTPTVEQAASLNCPECDAAPLSTEVFEVFGMTLCADCAADLFDPGDGFPDTPPEGTPDDR